MTHIDGFLLRSTLKRRGGDTCCCYDLLKANLEAPFKIKLK